MGFSQDEVSAKFNPAEKGKLFVYWGYNRAAYSNSNISFSGADYNFTLDKVAAKDRQSAFDPGLYFGLQTITIPQYNLIIGYFIKDGLSLSFNADHMKYVMVQDQASTISGSINSGNSEYDGTYTNDPIILASDFLRFEHTDGLNYLNIGLTQYLNLWSSKNHKLNVSGLGSIALGALVPKSNVLILEEGSDEFHLAGFGTSVDAGLSFTFFKNLVLQYKVKGGYINMPDIVTNGAKSSDRAKQTFWFFERFFTVGANIPIKSK